MRTASIAALVIAGGTLAALPFRLSPTPPDFDEAATGPSHSVLDETQSHIADLAIFTPSDVQPPPVRTVARRRSYVPAPDWTLDQTSQPSRPDDMPLTFDDLMIPIDSPAPISQRFDATMDSATPRRDFRNVEPTPSQQRQPAVIEQPSSPRERSVGTVASSRLPNDPRRSMPATREFEPQRETMMPSESLQSLPANTLSTNPLPENNFRVRQKHWIVQP